MNTTAYSFFIFVHILGLAALMGGQIVQLREKTKHIDRSILYGAFLIIVSDIVLFAIDSAEVVLITYIAQLALVVLIASIALRYRSKKIPQNIATFLFVLSLAKVLIALAWFI